MDLLTPKSGTFNYGLKIGTSRLNRYVWQRWLVSRYLLYLTSNYIQNLMLRVGRYIPIREKAFYKNKIWLLVWIAFVNRIKAADLESFTHCSQWVVAADDSITNIERDWRRRLPSTDCSLESFEIGFITSLVLNYLST